MVSEANWHLPVIKAELNQRFIKAQGYQLPQEPSAYSVFVIEQLRSAIQGMVARWPGAEIGVSMVALRGAAAFGLAVPFHRQIEGKDLPPQLFELTRIVYCWLFSSLGKSARHTNLRLLDKAYTPEILIDVYLSKEYLSDEDELVARLKDIVLTEDNIFFPVSINIVPPDRVDISHLLSSYVIFGWDQAEQMLRHALGSLDHARRRSLFYQVGETLYAQILSSIYLKDVRTLIEGDRSAEQVRCYHIARKEEKAIVIIKQGQRAEIDTNDWWEANEAFFQTLIKGKFDEIQVQDATKRLEDKKGEEKDNRYTLCKVLGLSYEGIQIPAERVVLKLRGFSWYRGEIHNIIDLLKEYASYNYIFGRADDASRYFLRSGPLLLSCEKLNLPFEVSEKSRLVGLFLEEMTPPKTGRAFTCRVRRLSDFWALGDVHTRILREASEYDIRVNSKALEQTLKELAEWLWFNELSLDYCDLTLFLTAEGEISGVKIIDLERLAFGELVNEEHPILDCLIDVKSYLHPNAWHETLQALYQPSSDKSRFLSFAEIKLRLRKRGRKRWMFIDTLHSVATASRWLGRGRGPRVWRFLLDAALRLTTLMNSGIPQGK